MIKKTNITAKSCLFWAVKATKNTDGTYSFSLEGAVEHKLYKDKKGRSIVEYYNYGKRGLKFVKDEIIDVVYE